MLCNLASTSALPRHQNHGFVCHVTRRLFSVLFSSGRMAQRDERARALVRQRRVVFIKARLWPRQQIKLVTSSAAPPLYAKVRARSRARELQPLACAHTHVGNDDNCYNPCVLRASQAFADRINNKFQPYLSLATHTRCRTSDASSLLTRYRALRMPRPADFSRFQQTENATGNLSNLPLMVRTSAMPLLHQPPTHGTRASR